MSLAAMANNYALRTSDKRATDGADGKGMQARPTPEVARHLPNVPQGVANQLMRWIPTETLSIYAALAAWIGTDLSTSGSFWLLVACGVADVAIVWQLAVRKKVSDEGRTVSNWWPEYPKALPVVEIVLSLAAYVIWISALPNSLLTHYSWWDPKLGALGVLGAATVIPFLAANSGVSPPGSEIGH